MSAASGGSTIERWGLFEWTGDGPSEGNPYLEVSLTAEFRRGLRSVTVHGFYDGAGRYVVRFMPDEVGVWSFRTSSNVVTLDGVEGALECTPASSRNRGPVSVDDTFHFRYANREIYRPIGTTLYAWVHQPAATRATTLENLERARFNKVRMCVFPKHYLYNSNEPESYPFIGDIEEGFDFDRFNPSYFGNLERQILALQELGVEADVILFHPYDRWGFSTLTHDQDLRYLRYALARLAPLRNVWWSLANEFDLMTAKNEEQWEELIGFVKSEDPYGRLLSVHNADRFYDHSRPEITHVSLQHWNAYLGRKWREEYEKPIINDEPEYEGDIPMPWGSLTGIELVHRMWLMLTNGCYVSHGETFLDESDELWWAKGGELKGESWKRVGFLLDILDELPSVGLEPIGDGYPWTRVGGVTAGGHSLIYFGEHRPRTWWIGLPEDPESCEVDLIDPWNMTVSPLAKGPGPNTDPIGIPLNPSDRFSVRLPGMPYLALRVRPVSNASENLDQEIPET